VKLRELHKIISELVLVHIKEEHINTKGGVRYFQMGSSLPDHLYNLDKDGNPTRDPGIARTNKENNKMNHKDLKEAIRLATRQALKEVHLKEQANEETEAQKFCDAITKSFKKHFPNSRIDCSVQEGSGVKSYILFDFSLGKDREEYEFGQFSNDTIASKVIIHGVDENGKMPQNIEPKMLQGGGVKLDDFSKIKVWRNFKTPSPVIALQKFDTYFGNLKSTIKANLDKITNVPFDPASKI
jgi:hypothetical protein